MQEVVFDAYDDVALVMRNPDLAQALYDDGAVVMDVVDRAYRSAGLR